MMLTCYLPVRAWAFACCAVLATALSANAATIVYEQTVLADNPVAFWRMSEASGTAMNDSSGFLRHGTYNANVVLGAQGVGGLYSDRAATFNGTNADASSPGNTAYNFTNYTLEAWVKFDGPLVNDMRIASRQDGTGYWLLHTRQTGTGVAQLSTWSSLDGTTGYAAGPNLADNAFHHVAITRDTGTDLISLFVDGQFVGSQPTASNAAFNFNASTPVLIGSTGSGQFFPGIIDEIALYGEALSAARLLAHFEAGTAPPPAPEPATGLLLGLGALALAKRRRARRQHR